MRRWFVWVPLCLLLLLVVVLGAAVLARAQLAEAGLQQLLARRGVADAELTVATLTHRRLEITDLRLGADGPAAARLTVQYSLDGLLERRVDRIELDGPRLTVDLTSARPLGAIGELVAGPADAGDGGDGQARPKGDGAPFALPAELPRVALRNAAIRIVDARETVDLNLDGRLGPMDGDLGAVLRGTARASHTTADLLLAAEALRSDPRLQIELQGQTDLTRAPWPDAAPVRPTGGTLRFGLQGEIALPPLGAAITPAALLARDGALSAELSVADAALRRADRPLADGLNATADLRAELQDGGLLVRLDHPLEVAVAGLDADTLAGLGVPAEAARLLATARTARLSPWTGGGELIELRRAADPPEKGADREGADSNAPAPGWRLDTRASARLDLAEGHAKLQANLQGELGPGFALARLEAQRLSLAAQDLSYAPHRVGTARFEGSFVAKPGGLTLDGQLDASDLQLDTGASRLAGVSVSAPLAVRTTDAGTRVRLSGPGEVVLPSLPLAGPVRPELPLRLRIGALEASLLESGLAAQATIDPGELTARLIREDAPDLPVTARPGPIELTLNQQDGLQATATIRGAQIEAPAVRVAARELSADIAYGTDAPLARITVGRLVHLAEPAALAPSKLQVTVQRNRQLWAAAGELAPLDTEFALPFVIDHRNDTGRGGLEFGEATLSFAPGGLQPGQLSPLLKPQVTQANGEVALHGRIVWGPEGFNSMGEAQLKALDLTTPQATVEGLDGAVRFDRLVPPKTGPNQTLRAARVTAAVPLTEVTLRFDLDWPTGGPVLRLELAEGYLAEGRLYVENGSLAPLAERNALTLNVTGLSLAKLVEELNVEGMSADGVVDGQIPLAIGPKGVEIDRGRLEAVQTGALRVDLGQTSDSLASRGKQVALMVKALKNFQYDELSMTLHRPAGGNMELGIVMQGRNPEVLDGYPFRFNITLTGDLNPVLAALQEGRALTTQLLDQALQAR